MIKKLPQGDAVQLTIKRKWCDKRCFNAEANDEKNDWKKKHFVDTILKQHLQQSRIDSDNLLMNFNEFSLLELYLFDWKMLVKVTQRRSWTAQLVLKVH